MAKYVIDSNTMTSFADEIRAKTGLNDAIDDRQMVIDIAAIPTYPKNVPDYVKTEAERVVAAGEALQNDNTDSFIALSDVHARDVYQDSIIHAAQAVSIIKGRIPIDFTAVLGDIVYGAGNDTYDAHMKNLLTSVRVLSIADPDVRLDGNHDNNIYNADINLTPTELHRYTTRFNSPAVTVPETNADRGYFYLDIAAKKTRVVCINSSDLKDISPSAPQDGHHVSIEQLNWLISTLDMTGKTNWKIIVLSHHPIHWGGSMPNVLDILNGYINGTSGSTVSREGTTIPYDFSGKNAAELILCVNGHTHNLSHGKRGVNEIIQMSTPNACYDRNNEYGNPAIYTDEDFRNKYGETTTYAKTKNTANDTAFVVYTVDFKNEIVFSTCYGAGYDRTIPYGGSSYYIVTINLSGVTIDNTSTAIGGGAAYSATLTAGNNFELNVVTVTMNGQDITSNVYKNGVITINEVTGDIVITATSRPAGDNLVYTSINTDGNIYNGTGYKEGYRLNSSGGETELAGAISSGYISYDRGDIIYIYGSTSSYRGMAYFNLYGSTFNFVNAYSPAVLEDTPYTEINGKYMWTIDTSQLSSNGYYFRASFYDCSSDDFAIIKVSSGSVVKYNVTNNLTNVSSNSAITSIIEGQSYYATLAANVGYNIDSVVITMNGHDITSTAYSNGVITIEEVTGDIVITAIATSTQVITNVNIEEVGYTENARWSTSDGTIRTGVTGHVAVNLIPIERAEGQTVTVTLSGINWSYGANCVLVCFSGDTRKAGGYLNVNTSSESTAQAQGYRVTLIGDGVVKLEFFDATNSTYAGIDGFKVSGYGSASDVVITIK